MKKIKARYQANKEAKVGDECTCPSCGTPFTKTHYAQAFCKSKSGTKCKDKYWNTVDPKKRNNTTRISPASAAYMAQTRDENHYGVFTGRYTSEGYKIYGTTAINEFGEAVYEVTGEDDPGDSMYWDNKDF